MKRINPKHMFGRICAMILCIVMVFSVQIPGTTKHTVYASSQSDSYDYELVDDIQDAAILHCWNWSYKTIEENMKLIAQAGYSAVQTSPATQPKDYTYDGEVSMGVGIPGEGGSGNWWKLYQPVAECVCDNGQTWLGTKEELESMCAVAESYGIKVIVDVVANHMGNITGWKNSLTDVSAQVGEYWNEEMLTDESYWHINDYQCWMSDSRLHFTQGSVGMPDLNTADKRVQKYIADYLDELIDCGVDGFRFDTAKHIETPDDDSSFASDFWPTVLGEAESHYTEKTGGTLYVYGEILNTVGDNFSIDSYTKYMSVTDNSAGNHLLEAFRNGNVGTLSMDYDPDVSVLWAESHDTYMNESSRYASDTSIVRTWAMVDNKQGAAALFFVRPYYSSDVLENDTDGSFKSNLANTLEEATMGNCETYIWASDEVAAINHFRNRMNGIADDMGSEGNIAYCFRGNGAVLANFNGSGYISISSHGMADGTYTDEVSGNTFTVSNGTLSGYIDSEYGIAVVYQNVMPNPEHVYPVQIKNSVGDGTVFYSDSLEVTLDALYADSASYSATTGESGTFSGETTIKIGAGLSKGESVTLTVTASNQKGTKEETYTYTKDEYDLDGCIFFKNTSDWETVTAYLWNDTESTVTTNASWPGEVMYECDSDENIYAVKVDDSAEYTKVIFSNNGASQTADLDVGDIGYMYDPSTGEWTLYHESGDKTPAISASTTFTTLTAQTEITYSVTNATSATYTIDNGDPVSFDGSVTLNVGENLAEGQTQTITITASNDTKSATKTFTYTMDYKTPVISASVEDGTIFDDSVEVTFTVENADSAVLSVNGEEETFSGSITKTFTQTSAVTVSAVNGTKSASAEYTYTLYVPVPEVTASVDNGTSFDDTLEVTFTVTNADTATISDGTTSESFTGSITKTISDTTTFTIVAGDYTFTYSYKKTADNYIFLNVSGCTWFSNDSAVAAVKFDGEDSYTECETVTYNDVTYYKAAVPDGASEVSICRMLPSGNIYNIVTTSLDESKNLWTANSGFTSGTWTYSAALAGEEEETMTLYFTNTNGWSGTMYAYYWGGSTSVTWPGVEMTYVSENSDGQDVYKIEVPADITGIIFTNGSVQTVDITTDLEDGNGFYIVGLSGTKYEVSVVE